MRCTTADCPREAVTITNKCTQCAAYLRRWLKINSPARMRQRRATLAVWDNRLNEMLQPRTVKKKARR